MRTEMKIRMALLSILLVVGVLIASLGATLGMGEIITPTEEVITAEAGVDADGTLTTVVSKDGEVLGSISNLKNLKGEGPSFDGSAAIPGNCDSSGGEIKSSKS